ncbi:MAG: hypothetical protein DCF19_06140 [Pseudanabaena frigida]|uniref:Neurotransmitter-gated ion-channel ligand-binding domain-containing protein n=1 Tax=Pseudanabaena frigida TaxID=945775 RepID=A0A2W4WGC7_9CYAN|nr:MAG: hypothetical protein DCF19_06140 [Pseudanabaena frigida]
MILRSKACKFIVIVLLCFSSWLLLQVPSAFAEPVKTPQTCRVGIYITSLRDFKFTDKSFATNFRVWSVCPTKSLKPLESIQIINSLESEELSNSTIDKKNLSEFFSTKENVYWSQRDISAVLYQNWDVQNYPFDRHILKISLEENSLDASEFIYTPDLKNSGYPSTLKLGGWKITDFSFQEEKSAYQTTFGDPELISQQGVYSRLTVAIAIQRVKYVSFFKLTTGVYVAFAVAMLSFFYQTGSDGFTGPRTSLLIGCLFSALVNMRAPESVLGRTESLTLVDQIHIIAIVYIFTASLATIFSQLTSEVGQGKQAKWFDRYFLFRLFTISFIVLNVIIISYAAIVG